MDENEFVTRCRSLAPILAEHAAVGEDLRRVPDVVVERVVEAELLPAILPPSAGGHGLGLRALCNGTRELAHGDPAAAWTLSFFMLHAWILARFPRESHDELFARFPTAAAPLAPTGRLVPTTDGFRVSGRWEWATGVDQADWVIVHGFEESAELSTRFAAIPVTEVTVEDVWFTSGMRATGSNAVVVDDVFVPSARTCGGRDLFDGTVAPDDDPLGALPLVSVLALTASAPAVGAAEAGAALHRQRIRERVLAYSMGERAVDQPVAQSRLAAVMSAVATTRAGWDAAIARLETAARAAPPDDLLRASTRLAAAAAVRASREILGTIGEGAGASVYASDHPFQRLQRDVETLKGHVVFDWDRATELAGRVAVGHELRLTDMA